MKTSAAIATLWVGTAAATLWDSCNWIQSDSNTAGQQNIGDAASPDDCIAMVLAQCPTATIANIDTSGSGGCWCQYGENPTPDSSGYMSCVLATRTGISYNDWGTGNGWCSSDLDELIGSTSDANACWTMCEDRYADLVAIDWTPDGECWCQNDCQCMEDTHDGDIHLITSDVAALPNTCASPCPAEEAAFEDCLSKQGRLYDDFFADDDDDSRCSSARQYPVEAALSSYHGLEWLGANCIDGSLGTMCLTPDHPNVCGWWGFDSDCMRDPWLRLTFATAIQVTRLDIYNRNEDCCISRLSDSGGLYDVRVGDDASDPWSNALVASGQAEPETDVLTIETAETGGPAGRYVFFRLLGDSRELNLREVEVHGCDPAGLDDDYTTTGGLLSASEREKCLDCQSGGRGYCISTGDCAYEMSGACFIDPTGPLGDLCVCGSPHDHIAASEEQLRSFCSAPRWDALLHWDCGVDEWRYDANSGIGTCTADTVWATPANPASSGDDDDDFVPRTCDDGQQWLSKPGGVCQDGPAVCRAEYEAYAVCYYEDQARDELGLACDFTCSASSDSKKRNNAELLIIIIVCSVAAVCCLLALGTAVAFGAFGSCACLAKKKKMRVAEPSEPPLAHATVIAGAPPPAKTQAHMTEGPPSPGPPPLAPIKATETLAAEMP